MAPPLASADQALAAASNQALALDRTAAAHSLTAAGKQIAALRDQISSQSGDDKSQALYEIDQVRARIDHALEDVVSLSIAVNADRHELVAGENFTVNITLPDQPAVPVKYTVDPSTLQLPSGWMASVAPARQPNANGNGNANPAPNPNPPANTNGPYRFSVSVPANATDRSLHLRKRSCHFRRRL